MALSFTHATKLIGVPQIDAQPLTMQTLINAIREEEASERGITEPQIAFATGKDSLGDGVVTGITVSLTSTWKLSFEAGAYQAKVNGGNLADDLARINNTGSPQVVIQSSAAATVINGNAVSVPSAAENAAAVLAAATTTPIAADIQKVRGQNLTGDGSEATPWGPA